MYSAIGADSVMKYDVGNAYHIMIIIKLKHKYVVVENMKFNSNRWKEYPSDHDVGRNISHRCPYL